MVGFSSTDLQHRLATRFAGKRTSSTKAKPAATPPAEIKSVDEPKSAAPTPEVPFSTRVLNALSQLLETVRDGLHHLLQWMSRSLEGFSKWMVPSTATTEKTETSGKVPLPEIPTDEEVDEAMANMSADDMNAMGQGYDDEDEVRMYSQQIKNYDKSKLQPPTFLPHDQVQSYFAAIGSELTAKPFFLLGNLEDQRNFLEGVTIDERSGSHLFKFLLEDYGNEGFNHLWSSVVTPSATFMEGVHPMQPKPDVTARLRYILRDADSLIPEGEYGTFFLIGNQQLQGILNALPEISRDFPRIKLIVAGMEQLSPALKQDTILESKLLPIPAPTVDHAIGAFHLGAKQALAAVIENHGVQVTNDGIEAVAQMLKEATGRAPTEDKILTALEKVMVKAAELSDPPAEGQEASVPVVTAEIVNRYQARLQKFVRENTAVQTVGQQEGSFFKTMSTSSTTFDQVIGQPDAVGQLKELAEQLQNYYLLQGLKGHTQQTGKPLNIKIPKLISFVGPPGTGKTLSARAMANAAGVPFYYLNASDFVNKYQGVGADRVRELFNAAYQNKPCIVFIDEIDGVAQKRDGGTDINDDMTRTLNTLLSEIDGIEERDGVTAIIATNRPKILDTAFKDRQLTQFSFKMPTLEDRKQILDVEIRKSGYDFAEDVDIQALAEKAENFSGRKLSKLIERCTNKVNTPITQALKPFRGQSNPDYQTIRDTLPKINQAMLMKELETMLTEVDEAEEKGPDPDNFGFAYFAKRQREEKARAAAEAAKASTTP